MNNEKSRSSIDFIRSIVDGTTDEVCRICDPLFKKKPIKHFEYGLLFDSGNAVHLATSADHTLKMYRHSLMLIRQEVDLFYSSGLKFV